MATGIAQKSYTALFPQWFLKERYVENEKKNKFESIEKDLNIKTGKMKTKSTLILVMLEY